MHIAIGYYWFTHAAGYHFERAARDAGHTVTYVGLPANSRPGYDSGVSIADIVAGLPHKPDLYLWIDPAGRYFPRGIEDLDIPSACYLIDVHLGAWRKRAARFFDAVFVAQKDYLPAYREAAGHDQVWWLPLAAAPDVHRRYDLPRIYDIGFVGSLTRAHQRASARLRRLELISARFKTNDFRQSYTPEEVGRIYSQSRIVFNASIAGDVTMRVFEGAASGALVLTDSIANGLSDLFDIGSELVVYHDDDDLLARIAHYLANETERARIAEAGYRRVHAQHTYAHRIQTIIQSIADTSFRMAAPVRQADRAQRLSERRAIYTRLHMLDIILDDARAQTRNPLRRAIMALPCLARRLR